MKSLREIIDIVENTEGAIQEYTVRVVDSANKTYKVKVTAPSEEGAKHKAVVQVRNEYGVRPEGVRIMNQDIEEGQDVASAEVLLKRYELLTQSIRNAIDQRDYNEKFKHIEQIRDALEKHYGIDPDKMNEEATPDAVQKINKLFQDKK